MQDKITYDDLFMKLKSYMHNDKDIEAIKKAYDYACTMHENQFRKSGEPYIIHPIQVACILAELKVGPATIIAGLLHDVVEDTETSYDDIVVMFGEDVANIVEGVTKVGKLKFSSLEKQQAENHQKMLLAMAKDIRVIVVKLADRLHNIRTIASLPEEKRLRICQETLEIYAPLAHKLGMFKIKAELEDCSLRYVDPLMYTSILKQLTSSAKSRLSTIDAVIDDIKNQLNPNGVTNYTIKGRIKNIYSIYKKMKQQDKEFDEIYDILAIRIIVDNVANCYQVLGLIHAHYTPVPKRFKDYIAVPKPNLYQSLHTTVIASDGQTFEVQIRTEDMDQIAEIGIAAHWAYKDNVAYSKEKEQFEIAQKLKWYADLLQFSDEKEEKDSAEEFVESIKDDILAANVYVYTPTGDVIALPKSSTPIDFAYKIHTNLGNKMVGAIVNNRMVPIDTELMNGDIVSIKINKNSFGPSADWIKIVKTSHAKHKIKSFLNKQNRDVLIAQGKSSLDIELSQIKKTGFELSDQFVIDNFSKNNLSTIDDMYCEIGKGNLSVKTVGLKITGAQVVTTEDQLQRQIERSNKILTTNSETGVVVEGLSNPQLKLGACCNPIPGDEIEGYITKGNGIMVHHKNCKNLAALETNRVIDLTWATNPNRKYPVNIKITASQSNNLLAEILNTVSANNMYIASISQVNNNRLESVIKVKLLTYSLVELQKLIVNMKKIPLIHNIERENL